MFYLRRKKSEVDSIETRSTVIAHLFLRSDQDNNNSVDTGHKLNVHKTFRRRPGRLLNVLCTFNLGPVSTGNASYFSNY